MSTKRLNYFTHQLLREQDFKDEQAYHLEARRRHNRSFHSFGIVEGLEVRAHGEHEVTVEPGMAIDSEGREILLQAAAMCDLTAFTPDTEAYIAIEYADKMDEADRLSMGGVEGFTRITETAVIQERRHEHLDPKSIVLAKVRVGEHGHVGHIDTSATVRKIAKEAASPAQGWMRLPFKPVRLNPVRIGTTLAAGASADYDFIVDEAVAYCGEHGARGSMQIPVPPGATHVSGFRLAGTTHGEVTVRLFRTGWNRADAKGEKTKLLEETLTTETFYKEVSVNSPLDELHGLAVSIRADNESEICLVAVRFN